MRQRIKDYIESGRELMLQTLKEMCAIPAPSHYEHDRARYCKQWLENIGAQGVYIDDALNVVFPLNCEGSSRITVFAAHTDTVFPDREPMPYFDDGEKIHCPGASDDTASVAVLLMMAKFFVEQKLAPAGGILFVCNSCEEGLGNLKGTRRLFQDYAGRIRQFITFDSSLDVVSDRCVGSHRYEVEVRTPGGHSFGAFGNANAIAELSGIVKKIYEIQIPNRPGTRTTYNVGTVSGGTSVNTIAQDARMLCEYRSDDAGQLAVMERAFTEIFESARSEQVQVQVTKVGDRPCANIDPNRVEALKQNVVPVIEAVIGSPVRFSSSSTDCNIPLSLGIPALCVGTNRHAGMHTREEWVGKESLIPGLDIAIGLGRKLTEEEA